MKNAPVVVAVVVVLLALLRPSEGWLSSFAQPLTPSQGAHRQARAEYTECFAAKLWTADGEDVNGGKLPKTGARPRGLDGGWWNDVVPARRYGRDPRPGDGLVPRGDVATTEEAALSRAGGPLLFA